MNEVLSIPERYKYIGVFLSFRCNLNCSFCLNDFSKTFQRKKFEELSGEQWVTALNKIEPKSNVPITFCGGEPSVHKDFIYILNNLNPNLEIDILSNLWWNEDYLKKFISEVNPERIKRNSPYPSIRVSYHPEQMGEGTKLLKNVKILLERGFSIGIESVMFPNSNQLSSIERMAILCKNQGISFRPKSFTGIYNGIDDSGRHFSMTYGDYSRYKDSAFNDKNLKSCKCRTTELLISPEGNLHKCHRDLLAGEFSIGNITYPNFVVDDKFRFCNKYGQCHPCDVKVKTNYKQELDHTSVEIKNVRK